MAGFEFHGGRSSGYYGCCFVLLLLFVVRSVSGGGEGVIRVNYKFKGSERTLTALSAHDDMRHLRILAGVDLPIGGTGRPDSVGYLLISTSL